MSFHAENDHSTTGEQILKRTLAQKGHFGPILTINSTLMKEVTIN